MVEQKDLRKKLGQHILMGVSGHSLTTDEKKFIVENNISGVVLFGRNVSTPEQVQALCGEIQGLRHSMPDKTPLFIGVDMEGGRVARLKAPFTQWPPLRKVGDLDSPTVAFYLAYYMGLELKSVGINLDFAPCVDVYTNPANTVIGDRSLSSDPEVVAKMASALVRGYMKSEIISCVKHFPGHGNTLLDSHFDLPVENVDMERLSEIELTPFKRTFRARVDMVMTAHICFPKIDEKYPATLSEIFVKKLIREELRYKGIIISDDLDMKAMANHFAKDEIPVRAIEAGVDILLYCNEPDSPPVAIESLIKATVDGRLKLDHLEAAQKRISDLKKLRLHNPDPLALSEATKVIGHPDHFKLSQAIARGEVPPGLVPIPN